jgi:peptide/nickel transport system substrate-binding protein
MFNLREPMFQDVRVRRALTMATDRQSLVDGLVQGYGEVASGPAASMQWERNEALEPWPYDPEEARRLLAEAGWRDTDGDGILDRDGRPLRFQMTTNTDNVLRQDILVALQSQFRAVGVDARPRSVEFNTMVDHWMSGEFDTAVAGWDLYLRLDPTQLFETGAPYNGGAYSNPRVDALLRQARTTLDRDAAEPLWDEFLQIVHDEQPYIFLIDDHERWGASRRLRDVAPAAAPNAYAPLASIARWWIPPDAR